MLGNLYRQRDGIERAKRDAQQQAFQFSRADKSEREQFERDVKFMDIRLEAIAEERTREPEAIRQGYQVSLVRFEPLGILYLWPAE